GIDIGTGSGVLAIALAAWEAIPVTAIDTDPCAVAEATANVRLNNLNHLIAVSNTPLETVTGPFSVLLANLRYPTLHRMLPRLSSMTAPDGCCIFSGVLVEEIDSLIVDGKNSGLYALSVIKEGRWAGAAFCRHRPSSVLETTGSSHHP
ncbi:MAG: 50S ribosomal protein L11 methyltransferase, partial [Desulfobacterales bacterium]